MKTLFGFIVALVVSLAPDIAAACTCCGHDGHGHAARAAAPPAAREQLAPGEARVTIPVAGMHCGHCASRIESALSRIDGVRLADARLDAGEVVVVYRKARLEASKLVEAIDGLGFKAGAPVQD